MPHPDHGDNSSLVLVLSDSWGQRIIPLDNIYYSIGRSPSSHIRLFDTFVSREHALIIRIPESNGNGYSFMIFDGDSGTKRSTNGLYVNGNLVRSHQLQAKDVIQFGPKVTALVETAATLGVATLGVSTEITAPPTQLEVTGTSRKTSAFEVYEPQE